MMCYMMNSNDTLRGVFPPNICLTLPLINSIYMSKVWAEVRYIGVMHQVPNTCGYFNANYCHCLYKFSISQCSHVHELLPAIMVSAIKAQV